MFKIFKAGDFFKMNAKRHSCVTLYTVCYLTHKGRSQKNIGKSVVCTLTAAGKVLTTMETQMEKHEDGGSVLFFSPGCAFFWLCPGKLAK